MSKVSLYSGIKLMYLNCDYTSLVICIFCRMVFLRNGSFRQLQFVLIFVFNSMVYTLYVAHTEFKLEYSVEFVDCNRC